MRDGNLVNETKTKLSHKIKNTHFMEIVHKSFATEHNAIKATARLNVMYLYES